MQSLPDFQDSLCALQVIALMLNRAARYQLLAYMNGDYGELPVFAVLIQLQALARYGVCSMTRVLEDKEMPSLARLLERLPEDARAYLETSFAAEKTGLCVHRPTVWGMEESYRQPELSPLVLSSSGLSPELLEFEREFTRRYGDLKRIPPATGLARHHSLPALALPGELLEPQGMQELLSSSGSRWEVHEPSPR